jgi:hypothetical protein
MYKSLFESSDDVREIISAGRQRRGEDPIVYPGAVEYAGCSSSAVMSPLRIWTTRRPMFAILPVLGWLSQNDLTFHFLAPGQIAGN